MLMIIGLTVIIGAHLTIILRGIHPGTLPGTAAGIPPGIAAGAGQLAGVGVPVGDGPLPVGGGVGPVLHGVVPSHIIPDIPVHGQITIQDGVTRTAGPSQVEAVPAVFAPEEVIPVWLLEIQGQGLQASIHRIPVVAPAFQAAPRVPV